MTNRPRPLLDAVNALIAQQDAIEGVEHVPMTKFKGMPIKSAVEAINEVKQRRALFLDKLEAVAPGAVEAAAAAMAPAGENP